MFLITRIPAGDEYLLRIEQEPHYWERNRMFKTHSELPLMPVEDILNNYEFCWDIGFGILLSARPDKLVNRDTSMVSIQDYPGYPVVRFDEVLYEPKSNRDFIKNIPVPGCIWNDDDTGYNKRIMYGIGKEVMSLLLACEDEWPALQK